MLVNVVVLVLLCYADREIGWAELLRYHIREFHSLLDANSLMNGVFCNSVAIAAGFG